MTVYTQTVNVGSSFEQTFVYTLNDDPVNLTGWAAVFRLRDESDRVISTVRYGDTGDRSLTIDESAGVIDVTMVASATAGFTAKTGTFELEIYEQANTGRVFRIIDGAVRYRPKGRAMLDNTVCVIKSTTNRVVVETQNVSKYQRIDRGPPGSRGVEGPTVLANSARIGAGPALIPGGAWVALDDQTAPVNCRHRLSIKSFSSIGAMITRAKTLGSCLCELEPGVAYTESSLDLQNCEGVVIQLGAHGNYNKGSLTLTTASGPAINLGNSLNCGIIGGQISAPNLPYTADIVSMYGSSFDTSGAFLDKVVFLGNSTYTTQGTSSTNLTIGTGSKVFTTQAGLTFPVHAMVTATSTGSGATMRGEVLSYGGTTLTVWVTSVTGSGAHTDWSLACRLVPTGAMLGAQINTRIVDCTFVRLRSGIRCTGYSHVTKVVQPTFIECELAAIYDPTGETWTIDTPLVEPTGDGRGRFLGTSLTPGQNVTGLTVIDPWCGDLDGTEAGPWIELYGPQSVSITGGILQGQINAPIKLHAGRAINIQGVDIQCGKHVEFTGTGGSTDGVHIGPNGSEAALSTIYVGIANTTRAWLHSSEGWRYFGDGWTNQNQTVGSFAANGILSQSLTGNIANVALAYATVLHVTTDANGRQLQSMVPAFAGRVVTVCNVGSFTLVIPAEETVNTTTAANRFRTGFTLLPGESMAFIHNANVSRWVPWANAVSDGTVTQARLAAGVGCRTLMWKGQNATTDGWLPSWQAIAASGVAAASNWSVIGPMPAGTLSQGKAYLEEGVCTENMTFTVYSGANSASLAAKTLTCTVTAGQRGASDTTHSVTINDGDFIAVFIDVPVGNASTTWPCFTALFTPS